MIKKKRSIAMITIIIFCIAMVYISPTVIAVDADKEINQIPAEAVTPEDAVTAATVTYSESYTYATINVSSTYVYAAPINTADSIDTLNSGHAVNLIYREYDYYYIQYAASNGVVKRGYILRSATNTTVSTWCQYPIYRTGYNKTSSSYPVYHTYYSGSAQSGTIYATEGETANSTLIVLCGYNNKYLIQYITNTSNNGSQQIKWKRGWVDPSAIALDTISEASGIDYTGTYYIQNVHTGKYIDIPSYNPVDGANMHIWDFHGGDNQEWKITLTGTAGTSAYVTFTTCQDTTKVLAVKNARGAKDVNIDLAVKGNPPSKDQEFYIVPASGYPGEYYIYSRLTGKCLQIGTNNTANGTSVYNRYPYVTPYNRWKLVPVYERGEDYVYNNEDNSACPAIITPSSLNYGVTAKYNISNLEYVDSLNKYNINFASIAREAISVWEKPTAKLYTEVDNNSTNRIIWSELYQKISDNDVDPYSKYGNTKNNNLYNNNPNTAADDHFDTFDITIYYKAIDNAYHRHNCTLAQLWKSVLIHEIGHSLGLGDMGNINNLINSNEVLSNPNLQDSIMVYYSDKIVLVPHEAEFAGVKKNYCKEHTQ